MASSARSQPLRPGRRPAPEAEPSLPESSKPAEDAGPRRLSLPLRTDGSVAFERMHGSTRDQLRAVFGNPRLAADLGLAPADARPALPPALGLALVQTLANLDLILVARSTKAPRAILDEHAAWTDADRALVGPPLVNVLNKYGSAVLAKYGDEVALVVALTSITTAKIAAVRDAMVAARPPATVVPIRSTDLPTSDPAGDAS